LRIIKVAPLKAFWEQRYPDSEKAIKAWIADAQRATWQSPNEILVTYVNASIIGNERVVFNIRGNNYRLVVAICYRTHVVLVKFIGTHAEYDEIDAETVSI
jgi:mRNA interferase HigB